MNEQQAWLFIAAEYEKLLHDKQTIYNNDGICVAISELKDNYQISNDLRFMMEHKIKVKTGKCSRCYLWPTGKENADKRVALCKRFADELKSL